MTAQEDRFRALQEALDDALGITKDQRALGIVSVWADRSGRALVWRRVGGRVMCSEEQYRPWIFAADLDDLAHLGAALAAEGTTGAERASFRYRALEGPPGAYCYLVSARDGRALERAILAGAAQRLGRPVSSLYDIAERYYWVGPVEQYLMSSGRVYFRGLAYGDLHRLQFDLETTALSPRHGRIFLAAVRDTQGLATTLESPSADGEAGLIASLCALIRERDPDVIENHNLFGFDLPFLYERARALGVPLQMGRPEGPQLLERYEEPAAFRRRRRTRYSVAGRELIDTLDAVLRHDFSARDMPGHGLKAAARYFGVAAPERTYLAGADVFATYQRDPQTARRYALDDVAEVDGISRRLLGAPFALAGMAPRRYERLASAGPAMGILEPMLVRAYLHSGAALPRQAPDSAAVLGNHAGGATHLFAEGVAQQVVKADIASMYPSIMRVFQIGPACDRRGVLLHLVDRLTDLRLQHKSAARTAPPNSEAAHQHNAVQAAMKILINSAYGYMGAGSMALFADRAAADEVTRRGRELLGQVVEALRGRGMVLLEADTDGVFFAAPLGWSEAQERALVAEVATTLPPGIRLEYEGRYQAMFVHEVKNYALLTYQGDLIVRGGALRSSRAEPFGERFLRQALRCTLTGDVPGLREAFLATVDALRARRLTAGDVAIQARLTKTPEEYAATRARLREAPYEALLAAGRTTWHTGERIRFYKAAGGAPALLPDPADDLRGDADEEDAPDGERFVDTEAPREWPAERRDYDVAHYLQVFLTSYVGRLRKAFAPEDFDQLFRLDAQLGLFDRPIETIQPLWIRCGTS
ncbi:MAG TPA: DNA polymerase domain-containing protein [Roseiflexaceae bacterium]|nr:DNA polymerase domain-containing protein [Roseiflexaceae bacterium]